MASASRAQERDFLGGERLGQEEPAFLFELRELIAGESHDGFLLACDAPRASGCGGLQFHF